MFCPKCGKELPSNAGFCSKCGTRVTSSYKSTGTDIGLSFRERIGNLFITGESYIKGNLLLLKITSVFLLAFYVVKLLWGYYFSPISDMYISEKMMVGNVTILLDLLVYTFIVFFSFYNWKNKKIILEGCFVVFGLSQLVDSVYSSYLINMEYDFSRRIIMAFLFSVIPMAFLVTTLLLFTEKKIFKYIFILMSLFLLVLNFFNMFNYLRYVLFGFEGTYYLNGMALTETEKSFAYLGNFISSIPCIWIYAIVFGSSLKFKYDEDNNDNDEAEKETDNNMLIKNICAGGVGVGIAAIALCIILIFVNTCKVFESRSDLDFYLSKDAVEMFLRDVSRNVDAESFDVVELKESLYHDAIYAFIDIKLTDTETEKIEVDFYSGYNRNIVSYIEIRLYKSYTQEEVKCITELSKAVEITLSGNTHIESYIDDIQFDNPGEICDYLLVSDETDVKSKLYVYSTFACFRVYTD